jgi:nucleoside-diphosphate-sugar epimerase
MRVFIAGGSGTMGVPLVRALVAGGHQVTALTRAAAKQEMLQRMGAAVSIADALDREALIAAVHAAAPTHVIHQLTALPKAGPRRARDLEATNRLRVEGTRNLLDAAIAAGARRLVVGSFAMLSRREQPETEPVDAAAQAVRSMEAQVLDATTRGSIDGVILRYGLFYGMEVPSTVAMIGMVRKRMLPVIRGDAGQLPVIHVEDAVRATVRALDAARAGGAYEIVDDRPVSMAEIVAAIAEYTGSARPFSIPAWLPRLVAPYMARMSSIQLPLSNAKAKAELGWQPKYPTLRDGLAHMLRAAA